MSQIEISVFFQENCGGGNRGSDPKTHFKTSKFVLSLERRQSGMLIFTFFMFQQTAEKVDYRKEVYPV